MKLLTIAAAVLVAIILLVAAPNAAAAVTIPPPDSGGGTSVPEPVAPTILAAAVMLGLTHRPKRGRPAVDPQRRA